MSFIGTIFFGIAVAGVIMFAYSILRLISIQERVDKSVKDKFESLQSRLGAFEHRLSLLQGHALDYMNSLSGEGTRALYRLQQILSAQRELMQQIESQIKLADVAALREAEKMLDDANSPPSTTKQKAVKEQDHTEGEEQALQEDEIPRTNWEQQAEELFQLLGLDIALASESSKSSGLPRRRKRQPTSLSLEEAGILAAYHTKKPGPEA